jgi:hypothetical protein
MIDIKVLRTMAASGATVEAIIAAVEVALNSSSEKAAAAREANRQKQKRWRERRRVTVSNGYEENSSKINDSVTVSNGYAPSSFLLTSSADSSSSKTQGVSEERSSGRDGQFDEFWEQYPNKVGKKGAKRKFAVALQDVEFTKLMEGLRAYCAKTDDRPWCNPATWLNEGRWDDKPAIHNGANGNGHGRSGTFQEDHSASRAAGRLLEKARNGEFTFGPRPLPPGTLPRSDEDDAGVLSPRRRD